MAKIFRFSGYVVESKEIEDKVAFSNRFVGALGCMDSDVIQQLHIEESERFRPHGELEENCDLALLTRHFKKAEPKCKYDRPLPLTGQKYRHFKLGKIVTVIGLSRHTETEEVTVVYKYEGHIWNRPLEMFMSEVDREKYPNAIQKYRFELMED